MQYWQQTAKQNGFEISISGLPALSSYSINSENSLAYKTLITQELLKKGYLASNTVYVCTEHKPSILDGYFNELESVIKLISECENGRDVQDFLEGPICYSGFTRLN